MKNLPLVTVSIPTRNSSKTIELCLKAVKCQTYKNIEINIIDNHSTDETIIIAKKNGVKNIKTYNEALLGARYEGAKIAKGEFVLLLDSDQILEKDCIKKAILKIKNCDFLFLEEDVYYCANLLEKLFQYDRKLINQIKDIDPNTSAMLPRFFRKKILLDSFKRIPKNICKSVGGQDHAIIYFEVWEISKRGGILPEAVKHIEPHSLIIIFKKFYRWGYTSVGARSNKYSLLLNKKERFRKGLFRKNLFIESIASIVLMLIKGIPFKIGYFAAKFLSK